MNRQLVIAQLVNLERDQMVLWDADDLETAYLNLTQDFFARCSDQELEDFYHTRKAAE
jgi:hypothetical protein